jgi:DNA-binding beta-propeller fold protein YncE
MWLLARPAGAANLQLLNLTTGKIILAVPAAAGSVAVAQSPSGLFGVGLATSSTGALELRNGSSGVVVGTVPIGAPVKSVFAGADGTTFYVLDANAASASVTLVNSQTAKASVSVPVPLDTVAIAVDPSGQNLFAVGPSGTLDQITIGSGTVAGSFPVGGSPKALAISPSGATIYVLKSSASGENVGVVDVATESQVRALPAPAQSVGLQPSPDGHSLYLVVGTATYGNIQAFALPA